MVYPIADDKVTKAFQTLGNEWALLSAGDGSSYNSMTISWGSLGFIWRRPIVTVVVRPPRFTYQFTETFDVFSVSFYRGYRRALSIMGSLSGRDTDKVTRAGLSPLFVDGVPTFKEAYLTVIAREIYRGEMTGSGFLIPSIRDEFYPKKDFHVFYHADILKVIDNEKD